MDFKPLLKNGATDLRESYVQVIQSMFWAVKVNKQTILNGADPDKVLASIPDPMCRAWKMKLNRKTAVDPGMLVDDTDIGSQTAAEMMKMKPQEVFELVEEELVGKSKEQINAIKKCIGNVCREQALAHRHAAEAADNLASLTELVSLPILIKVISVTMIPTVAIKIPEVDDMMAWAQVIAANPSSLICYGQEGWYPLRDPTMRLAALDAERIPNRKGTSRCVNDDPAPGQG